MGDGGCDRRLLQRILRRPRRGQRGNRHRFPGVLAGQSVVDPQLFRGRAPQCARRAHRADDGNVGRHQQHVARAQAVWQQAEHPRGDRTLSAMGAKLVLALRRLGLPDHAAQRRLLVLAARRLHGACRQHRAHSRREISSAAAGGRARRRPARLFPVVGDPALGVGSDRLSLGVPRKPQVRGW